MADYKTLAEAIVAGTQDPESGWYNSPDDVTAVIAKALEAAHEAGAEGNTKDLAQVCAARAQRERVSQILGSIAGHLALGKGISPARGAEHAREINEFLCDPSFLGSPAPFCPHQRQAEELATARDEIDKATESYLPATAVQVDLVKGIVASIRDGRSTILASADARSRAEGARNARIHFCSFVRRVEKLLRHGKEVIYRQGWEKGMTAEEWETEANCILAEIEQDRCMAAQAEVTHAVD